MVELIILNERWKCMGIWDPWRGCHRYSEGCRFCYIHKGDSKRNVDTNKIVKTDKFYYPIEKKKNGEYKMTPGSLTYLCFRGDFLIEEADEWRKECWKMIKERSDCTFLFLTKRIERLPDVLPDDWNDGYDNVIIGVSIENQEAANKRLPIFLKTPIKHRNIICQPLIEKIDIQPYLKGVEYVTVGGESDKNARVLKYDWVLDIREQCIKEKVTFQFRQCGTNFEKDGILYTIQTRFLCQQARKANIDISF